MKRDAMIECMEKLELGMTKIQETRDIWQNDLVYWLCRSTWLLLENAIKENDKCIK